MYCYRVCQKKNLYRIQLFKRVETNIWIVEEIWRIASIATSISSFFNRKYSVFHLYLFFSCFILTRYRLLYIEARFVRRSRYKSFVIRYTVVSCVHYCRFWQFSTYSETIQQVGARSLELHKTFPHGRANGAGKQECSQTASVESTEIPIEEIHVWTRSKITVSSKKLVRNHGNEPLLIGERSRIG